MQDFLIKFTLYNNEDEDHAYHKTERLVRAESFEEAVKKLERHFVGFEVQDPENLTIE